MRRVGIVVALGLTLALSSCGVADLHDAKHKRHAKAHTVDPLDYVHAHTNFEMSDAKIVELADVVCRGFDQGLSLATVVPMLTKYVSLHDATVYIAYAITNSCPEYRTLAEES